MAFEEMSGPRTSVRPKQVFASFDSDSTPAGITTHRPSASLLKDTPPSIIVALAQLAPIVSKLNYCLALITWTGEDNWSSFLLLGSFWLLCLCGDVVFHYAGNWLLLLFLGIGYFRKRTRTTSIVHAIQQGDDPITTGIEDTQKVMDATLYEIDCLRARCHLLGSTFDPVHRLFTWKDPQQSAIIGMRLVLCTPLYIALLWFFTNRVLLLITGTFFLTFTSPWFKVICTVCWRLRMVRRIASLVIGVEYLPGESNFLHAFTNHHSPSLIPEATRSNLESSLSGDSKFTTTIAVVENQRRWLGLGWTPSLLPHERAPFTDVDDRAGAAPDNTALPMTKTTTENDVTRTISWTWIDSAWRIEKDRGRDVEGWLYFDNTWRHPSATEDFGKYTRRRKWIRNAECTEHIHNDSPSLPSKVSSSSLPMNSHLHKRESSTSELPSRTLSPAKVTVSTTLPAQINALLHDEHQLGGGGNANGQGEKDDVIVPIEESGQKREWRQVNGGGRELIPINHFSTIKKRPTTTRRKSSRASLAPE